MIFVSIAKTDDAGKESGRYWLVGDPGQDRKDHTPAGNVQPTLPRMQQEMSGTDWGYKLFEDRQNASVSRQYSTTRQFADAETAWLWINSLSREAEDDRPHPFSGSVIERFVRTADDSFIEERIVNAVVAIVALKQDGRSVELTYAVKGSYIESYGEGQTVTVVGLGTDGGTTASYLFTTPANSLATDEFIMLGVTSADAAVFGTLQSGQITVKSWSAGATAYADIAAALVAAGIPATADGSGVTIQSHIAGASGSLLINIFIQHADFSTTTLVLTSVTGTSVLVGITDDDGLSLIGDVEP